MGVLCRGVKPLVVLGSTLGRLGSQGRRAWIQGTTMGSGNIGFTLCKC